MMLPFSIVFAVCGFVCSNSVLFNFFLGFTAVKVMRYLSVIGFVINIDTLMQMIPKMLADQQYILTYRFSQDHLELLFNSIRASGSWSNNPTAGQFQAIFRRLMARCGVKPVQSGNVTEKDATVNLCAQHFAKVSLHAAEMSSADAAEELPSPFVNIAGLVCDHSYLPTRFGSLVDNALVYIAGFVVLRILSRLSCDVCRESLVSEATKSSFSENYHLLTLKNNGGLVIPSNGTVQVVRTAERAIRHSSGCIPRESVVTHFVIEEIGTKDVFLLREHIEETQFGIENHQSLLITYIVCQCF
ncbi:uncharacterized protein LOC129348937 [Amphiprion ocellaris]|uniref:uncharacterized protein LOC129348937 n=1 Tax=Amphiprion ocellaris TaxID=80972 RepID=UPI002410DE68|nr:uncharacterized protein LOC129348937 [Amphiprion ocellaris]